MTKNVVCPACEGEGTVDNFGSFTSSDLDEWYGDSDERYDFVDAYKRGDIGRENCHWCKGRRVVPAVDEFGDSAEQSWREECDYRAEIAAEQRMMGYY
jgi:RecJ-like exonuclease